MFLSLHSQTPQLRNNLREPQLLAGGREWAGWTSEHAIPGGVGLQWKVMDGLPSGELQRDVRMLKGGQRWSMPVTERGVEGEEDGGGEGIVWGQVQAQAQPSSFASALGSG